ncbi:hypothetical protein [Mesorhizobium sp. M0244]|uniref:hypothetical protein n=1 Tax=Mesorhizobium sp. M0244 TaxID=2956926 RepID=UPI0033361FCE
MSELGAISHLSAAVVLVYRTLVANGRVAENLFLLGVGRLLDRPLLKLELGIQEPKLLFALLLEAIDSIPVMTRCWAVNSDASCCAR